MDKYEERFLKIEKQYISRIKQLVEDLVEENQGLKQSLEQSLRFYTALEYRDKFHENWDFDECKSLSAELAIYCRTRCIRIKENKYGGLNSYPLTAWEDFLKSHE